MREKIPISWLHSHDYCEYQIYLKNVKGLKIIPTANLVMGRNRHNVLEVEHKEMATEELSIDAALDKAKTEEIVLIGREIPVEGSKLKGRIDEVHFGPNQIIILDDKPNSYAWDSNKKQIWGYCLAFEEHYSPKLPLLACLRHRDSQRIVWQEIFTDQHRDIVLDAIARIFGVLRGERDPDHTDNIKKCLACNFYGRCDMVSTV